MSENNKIWIEDIATARVYIQSAKLCAPTAVENGELMVLTVSLRRTFLMLDHPLVAQVCALIALDPRVMLICVPYIYCKPASALHVGVFNSSTVWEPCWLGPLDEWVDDADYTRLNAAVVNLLIRLRTRVFPFKLRTSNFISNDAAVAEAFIALIADSSMIHLTMEDEYAAYDDDTAIAAISAADLSKSSLTSVFMEVSEATVHLLAELRRLPRLANVDIGLMDGTCFSCAECGHKYLLEMLTVALAGSTVRDLTVTGLNDDFDFHRDPCPSAPDPAATFAHFLDVLLRLPLVNLALNDLALCHASLAHLSRRLGAMHRLERLYITQPRFCCWFVDRHLLLKPDDSWRNGSLRAIVLTSSATGADMMVERHDMTIPADFTWFVPSRNGHNIAPPPDVDAMSVTAYGTSGLSTSRHHTRPGVYTFLNHSPDVIAGVANAIQFSNPMDIIHDVRIVGTHLPRGSLACVSHMKWLSSLNLENCTTGRVPRPATATAESTTDQK